ncbi:MAG TPA: hypothetical protein PKW17_12640, partial [Smithellaceae bacterium]|nr:hypothetical protein [Smithellaceae bacterium]HRS90319.1 hypothetical protein [Smithellaceae bacterium]
VSRTAMSLYYSNAIPASLSNPQTRGATLAQLKDDGYRERYYKHLSPDQVAEMERMRASAGEESVRQDAYFQLHSKYGGNLEAMDRALDNPKTMSSLGITIEDAAYIKGFIGRSIETKERAQKMRWDRTANQVFLNLHQMSPAQIDEYVQRGDLSWQLGEQFKKDLKAVQDAPTNPQTYMRIYTQIKESVGDSDALTKTRLEIYSSTGLSWMDKKTLLNMTGEQEGKLEAHLANQGAEYIKRVLMPTMSVGGLTKPEESKQLLDAMAAYEAGFQRLKKSGKPLTADAVNQLAKDVANAYVLSPTELVQRSIQRMNEQKEKAPGKKDKHGYVPGEKKVINGATYEYIGNDQWQKL